VIGWVLFLYIYIFIVKVQVAWKSYTQWLAGKKRHNYVTVWPQLQALRRVTKCLLFIVVVDWSERSQILISALISPSPTEVNHFSRKGICLTSAVAHSWLLPHLLQFVTHREFFCVIWGFRCSVNKTLSLLEYKEAFIGSLLPTFRENISILFLSVKRTAWPL
jgi:hypothetical protein